MAVVAVHGWLAGGKRRRGQSGRRIGTRRIGVDRLPGLGIQGLAYFWLDWRRRRMGGTGPGGCLRGIGRATFLFGALHRAGFANQGESRHRGDGLELRDAFVTAIVRCAPPANRPSAEERAECQEWLEAELDLLVNARVAVALGGEAWRQVLRVFRERGLAVPRPAPKFGHGVEAAIGEWTLLGAYHPSQQNTFTRRLTPEMLDAVSNSRARKVARSLNLRRWCNG